MSRQFSDQAQFATYTDEVYDQIRDDLIESAARHAGYLKQREADEQQAGRRFDDARDWIHYTEMTKGERSGNRLNVQINTRYHMENILYTQTYEYHKTGSGSISSEHVGLSAMPINLKHGNRDVYRMDIDRAREFEHVLASTRSSNTSPSSGPQSQSRSSGPASSRRIDDPTIRFPAGLHLPIAANIQESEQIRIVGGRPIHQERSISEARVQSLDPSFQLMIQRQLEALATSVALATIDD